MTVSFQAVLTTPVDELVSTADVGKFSRALLTAEGKLRKEKLDESADACKALSAEFVLFKNLATAAKLY